jgi:hypothetical protein
MIKEKLMIPWAVRMNVSVTNQIMPKYSLEILTRISRFKYLGHTMHSSYSMKKRSDVRTDRWQWKIKEDSVQDDQQKYEEP